MDRPVRTCRDIMGAVARELGELADAAESLQAELGPVAAPVLAMQSLDKITQALAGLADFLNGVTPGLDAVDAVDIQGPLAGIKLGRLARRLGGLAAAPPAEPAGLLELFGAG